MSLRLTKIVPGDKFRSATNVEMESLRMFIERSWDAMAAHRAAEKKALDKSFPERLKKTVSDGPIEADVVALFHYGRHLREFTGHIPRLLNYSAVLQVYTSFEELGRNLCSEIVNRDTSLPLSIKDLRFTSDFEAIRLFLEKLCKVKFRHWSMLDAFRKIRNCIVHHGGMVGTDRTKQLKFSHSISPVRHMRYTSEGRLHVTKEMIKTFLSTVEELWEAVFAQRHFGPVGTLLPKNNFDGALVYKQTKKGHSIKIVAAEDDWI